MNIRKTVALGILLVVAVVYLTKVSEPRRRVALESNRPLSEINVPDFSRVQIAQGETGTAFTLVRQDAAARKVEIGTVESTDAWSISEFPGAMIDQSGLNVVLTTLRSLTLEGPLNEKKLSKDFAVYGLDKPRLTVVAESSTGEPTEVSFGKKSEYLQQRYVMVSGRSGVFLVDENAFATLNKSSQDIRSKTPLAVVESDVREVSIDSPAGHVELSQPTVGMWRITKPAAYEASSKAVSDLLNSLRTVQVAEFIDDGRSRLAEFGLETPIVKLLVRQHDGVARPLTEATFGKGKDGGVYFTYPGAPSVFKATADVTGALSKGASDLREKRLWKFTFRDIDRLVSSGSADTPVDIKAGDVDWTVNGKVGDPVFVEQVLNDIAQVEAHTFTKDVPPDAFVNPFVVLTISTKGDASQKFVLTVGKETKVGQEVFRYARLGEGEEAVLLRDVEAKRIVPHEGALMLRATPIPTPSVSPKG
jgi:hypothetical protein